MIVFISSRTGLSDCRSLLLAWMMFFLSGSVLGDGQSVPLEAGETASGFPYALIGMVLSEIDEGSQALIKHHETGELVVMGIGEELQGYVLVEIHSDRVNLCRGGRSYSIFLRGSRLLIDTMPVSGGLAGERKIPPELQMLMGIPFSPVRKEEKILSRSEAGRRILQDWARITQETKLTAYRWKGEIHGFRLAAVPSNSLLTEMGLQSNDVIVRINGREWRRIEELFSLYSQLDTAAQIELVVLRNGAFLQYLYILKD